LIQALLKDLKLWQCSDWEIYSISRLVGIVTENDSVWIIYSHPRGQQIVSTYR